MSPTQFSMKTFFLSEISLTVSGISLTLSGISLTVSGIPLTVSGIPLSIRIPCRLVWINGSSYKYRNTRYWKPVYVEITPVTEVNGYSLCPIFIAKKRFGLGFSLSVFRSFSRRLRLCFYALARIAMSQLTLLKKKSA